MQYLPVYNYLSCLLCILDVVSPLHDFLCIVQLLICVLQISNVLCYL